MTYNKKIPFYSNTKDNTHCYQAVYKMILKYYFPRSSYTWKQLDKITAKTKGLWTWPMAGLLWMVKKHFEIIVIEPFDYKHFIKSGGNYLLKEYGKKVGESQIKHSDIKKEIKNAKKFVKNIKIEKRIPNQTDLKKLIKKDYLIICNVNSRKLNKKKGYAGHFVLLKGLTKNNYILHDPGLPPYEDRKVKFDLFNRAWAYPNKNAKGIMAVKFNSQ